MAGRPMVWLTASRRGAKSLARILARNGGGGMAVSAGASGGDIWGQKVTRAEQDIGALRRAAARVIQGYAAKFGIERDAAFCLGKLSEELGEMTAAWLKLNGRARGPGDRQAMEDELADLLGFVLLFAEWQGIDLPLAFQRKWGAFDPGETKT